MELKFGSNAKRRFQVDGGILYRQSDKFNPFQRCAINADAVVGLIVQEHRTNSMHSPKNKTFTALNWQFYSIKRQEVVFLLKHCM